MADINDQLPRPGSGCIQFLRHPQLSAGGGLAGNLVITTKHPVSRIVQVISGRIAQHLIAQRTRGGKAIKFLVNIYLGRIVSLACAKTRTCSGKLDLSGYIHCKGVLDS